MCAETALDTSSLRDLLAAHVVDDDVAANYFLRFAASARQLHLLYWGGCLVARARTVGGILDALLRHLGGHGPVPAGSVRLDAVAIATDAGWVALPSGDREMAWRVAADPRRGFTVPALPWLDVEARTAQVIPPLLPEVDQAALSPLLERDGSAPSEPAPAATVRGFLVPPTVTLDPPAALVVSVIEHRFVPQPDRSLSDLASVLRAVPVRTIPEPRASNVADLIMSITQRET